MSQHPGRTLTETRFGKLGSGQDTVLIGDAEYDVGRRSRGSTWRWKIAGRLISSELRKDISASATTTGRTSASWRMNSTPRSLLSPNTAPTSPSGSAKTPTSRCSRLFHFAARWSRATIFRHFQRSSFALFWLRSGLAFAHPQTGSLSYRSG